ncbi:MAG: RRXRR domain-containing protein [Candidatus Methanospirareceae archaeon]
MPNENRAGRETPWSASLAPSSDAACLEHAGFPSKGGATASDLNGEGTLSSRPLNLEESRNSEKRIISNPRVPVLAPDGEPLMPTKASRARRWIREGKAKPVRTKLGIFAVQLIEEPSGREKQPIVVGIDPGSKYTGIAATSHKAVFCGFNLELPDYIKGRMDKCRELRRNRRYRKCRRRECRFLNRTGHKIAPSILARKQLELRMVKELAKIYPISEIAVEDVAFDHRRLRYGSYFSQVEIGKNWLRKELERIAPVRTFKGWETSERRKELGLKKSSKKEERIPEAHVSDAIALCSLLLCETKLTPFHFDVVRRPKYSRRKLHLEQPSKGGVRRQYGGTTTPFVFRKGDYVEAMQGKKTVRGWVSGYTKNLISVSDIDWKRLGQFVVSKVRLLERNIGLLLLLKSKEVKEGEFLHPTSRVVSFA